MPRFAPEHGAGALPSVFLYLGLFWMLLALAMGAIKLSSLRKPVTLAMSPLSSCTRILKGVRIKAENLGVRTPVSDRRISSDVFENQWSVRKVDLKIFGKISHRHYQAQLFWELRANGKEDLASFPKKAEFSAPFILVTEVAEPTVVERCYGEGG